MAVRVTLSKKFLAEALKAKETPLYEKEPEYRGYSYEKDILPQARMAFPEYNKLYKTDKDFTKRLVRDLNNKDSQLLEQINEAPENLPAAELPNENVQQEPAETMQSKGAETASAPSFPSPTGISQNTPAPRIAVLPKEIKETANIETKKSMVSPHEKTALVKEQPLRFQSGLRSSIKTGFSNAGIFFKKASGKIGQGLLAFARPAGPMLGAGAGGVWDLGGKVLNGGINRYAVFNNRVAGAGRFLGNTRESIGNIGKGRGGLVFAFSTLGFMFLVGGIAAFAPNPIDQPTANAQPLAGTTGDISSCQFYRADAPASYKSSLLLSYISEASGLTEIPPSVLAAFIRVESPSSVNMSDDQVRNYASSCAVSPTGALGIMQIQPPGTTSARGDAASCDTCINSGAQLLGKTVQSLTKNDYCDPRTSIIIGAGWILQKMNYLGYQNTGKWNPDWTNDSKAINALANTYYGCLEYGDEKKECSGPYHYGKDVWTSVQNCKTTTPVTAIASCPVLNGKISTPSYQSDPARGHCGGSYSFSCNCGTAGRRAKAIDVPTNGREVVLPKIDNQDVDWTLIVGPYAVDGGEGGGVGYTFQAKVGSDNYYLDMLHLNNSSLVKDVNYRSGTPVAKSVIPHVHMTIGKNLKKSPVAGTQTDCDEGWLPSDFMCR